MTSESQMVLPENAIYNAINEINTVMWWLRITRMRIRIHKIL